MKSITVNGSALRRIVAAFLLFLSLCGAAQADGDTAKILADGLPPCPNSELAVQLRNSARAYFTISNDAVTQTYTSMNDQYATNPQKYAKGKLHDTYCIGMYLDYFGLIRKLIKGAFDLEAAIGLLLDQLMNFVCEQIGTAVENALSKLCVPLPDLGFSVELPTSRAGSCNGISMADLIKVTPGIPLQTRFPVPQNMLSAPLSRWIGADGPNGRF